MPIEKVPVVWVTQLHNQLWSLGKIGQDILQLEVPYHGPGIGLLAGGAAPTIVGLWFIGSDARWAAEGVDSGTWAAIGTPLLVTGLVLEGVGAVLLATAPKAGKRRARVSAAPTLAPTTNGFAFGLQGRF